MKKLVLIIVYLAVISVLSSDNRQWCPPRLLLQGTRQYKNPRVALMTTIRGQLLRTGTDKDIYMDGNRLSKFLYYYVGILGFDKIYMNVKYNATIYVVPPTVDDLYPSSSSCVSAWAKLGVIDWFTYFYDGPEMESLAVVKQWRRVHSFIPRFNEIRNKSETDWLLVADVDEFLVPINFNPKVPDWCQLHYPSLINQGLKQMLDLARSRVMQNDSDMFHQRNDPVNVNMACSVGSSMTNTEGHKMCQPLAAFIFPVYFWTNAHADEFRTDVMPTLRTNNSVAYDVQIKKRAPVREEGICHYRCWKSMHFMAVAPPMEVSNVNAMHRGEGFNVLSPRWYHNVLSFEIAHVKVVGAARYQNYLHRDTRMQELVSSYRECLDKQM